jgi:hypothetical protein
VFYSVYYSSAFLAATFSSCHLHSTVPLLDQNQTILTRNSSTDLFTYPIIAAHEKIVTMGAKKITEDPRASQDRTAVPGLTLPDIDMFFDANAATALSQLSKSMRQVTRQKFLAHWMQLNNPLLKLVKKVIHADDSLRITHDLMTNLIFQQKGM